MPCPDTLEYLYGLQRFGIKLGLENVRNLLSRAGDPQLDLDLVHVAGTNGKGSVCSILAALIQKAGHCTGLYTSPHLHQFGERIRVNGEMIGDDELSALTAELRGFAGDDIPATFFEFTTAIALCHFRNRGVTWGVLETGMGGRLDATNAVTPLVSVITPVSLDHAEHLGATLADVAAEKAGIVKPGVPVVSAAQHPEVEGVLRQHAEQQGAELYIAGHDFDLSSGEGGLTYAGMKQQRRDLALPLQGDHQHQNLALALAALEVVGVLGELDVISINEALGRVSWPGRLEWWPTGPGGVLLDGAHNVAGCLALAGYLEQQRLNDVQLIFGTKSDKSSLEMLAVLLPYASRVHLVAPPVERAAPLEPMGEAAVSAGRPVVVHEDVRSAVRGGLAAQSGKQTVVVAGSLFLVAAAREVLMEGQ